MTDAIKALAKSMGFLDCRFTSPFLTHELDDYRQMVKNGDYGDMGYLARHLPFKENPNLLLPGVQTAMVLTVSYRNTSQQTLEGESKIARYAAGLDYHMVISKRLSEWVDHIQPLLPNDSFYIGVDSKPLPERSLALKAGIGFKGRNHMVIRPGIGSYFFIGVVLTTAYLPPDPSFKGSCGTCTRCIDACPPAALGKDGRFHIQSCISYQTIERKTPLSDAEQTTASGWVFGCDICQEVCPFNHARLPLTNWPEWSPTQGVGHTLQTATIPRNTALYRSRKRVLANWRPHPLPPTSTP